MFVQKENTICIFQKVDVFNILNSQDTTVQNTATTINSNEKTELSFSYSDIDNISLGDEDNLFFDKKKTPSNTEKTPESIENNNENNTNNNEKKSE